MARRGGGGPLAAFLRVFVFCSFTSNRLVGDKYVALVDGLREEVAKEENFDLYVDVLFSLAFTPNKYPVQGKGMQKVLLERLCTTNAD